MKKLYIVALSLFVATGSYAQNVILAEDFEVNIVPETDLNDVGNNTTWVNVDVDGLPYTGPTGQRDGYWFSGAAFSDADFGTTVMMSNSWTDVLTPVANYLVLPPIHLTSNDGMFYWKSATYQTPRYLDGLQILVSTTGNLPEDFTDTLQLYAEYVSGEALADTTISNFVFSDGYVVGAHPEDYDYLEYHNDSLRFIGILRPDSASLAAYANQTIYLAICHGTTDDNLMSIDDLMVTGTGIIAGVEDTKNPMSLLNVYPNPAQETFRVSYNLEATGNVSVNLYDVTGKLVKPISNATQIRGAYAFDVDTRLLPAGQYNVVLQTQKATSTVKVTVQH